MLLNKGANDECESVDDWRPSPARGRSSGKGHSRPHKHQIGCKALHRKQQRSVSRAVFQVHVGPQSDHLAEMEWIASHGRNVYLGKICILCMRHIGPSWNLYATHVIRACLVLVT